MREVVRESLRRTHGGDVLVGLLAAAVAAAAAFGVEHAAASRTMPLEGLLVRLVGIPVVALVAVVPLAGIYARLAADEAGADAGRTVSVPDGRLVETLSLTGRTLRRRGPTLLGGAGVAIGTSLAVAVLVAVALHAVVLSLLTAAGYVSYALGYGQLVPTTWTVRLSGVLVGLGLSCGVLGVRFFDCLVCWTDAGPVAAVRESLRFALARPLTVGGYALVTTLLFAIPIGTYGALATLSSTLALGALVLVTGASVAVFATFHAQVCYRRLLPVCCERSDHAAAADEEAPSPDVGTPTCTVTDRPLVANPLALVLAILLVTALLAGSASVRALDVRPVDTPDEPGPIDDLGDPGALVDPAAIPDAGASHHVVQRYLVYNESHDEWVLSVRFEHEFDREQRRLVTSFTAFDETGEVDISNTVYLSQKHYAMKLGDPDDSEPLSDPPDRRAWVERTTGSWVVWSVPGYELVDEGETVSVESSFYEQDWEIRDETSETVTLGVEGSDVVPFDGRDVELREGSVVEVTLDRETGYVREIVQKLDTESDERDPLRAQVTFENWGDHDVERPDDIEEVHTVEWLWAVASY